MNRNHCFAVSERWDPTANGPWPQRMKTYFGDSAFINYDSKDDGSAVFQKAVEMSKPDPMNAFDDEESIAECPYFGGTLIFQPSQNSLPKSTHSNLMAHAQKGNYSYAGPSGPLFGVEVVANPAAAKTRTEPEEPIPEGAIKLQAVDRDSLLTLTPHELKKALIKRFKKGRCDASGLSKPYHMHIIATTAMKIRAGEKASYRCCEVNATGTQLGNVGRFTNKQPPSQFDSITLEPYETLNANVSEDGKTKSKKKKEKSKPDASGPPIVVAIVPHSVIWLDEPELEAYKLSNPKIEDDPYEAAVIDAKMNSDKRSVLLGYLMRSMILSTSHLLTALILDDCCLGDHDAYVLATILRHKPTATFESFMKAERLRDAKPSEADEHASAEADEGIVLAPPLRLISLRQNQITDIGVMLLKKAVKYHPLIEEVRLEANHRIRIGDGLEIPKANLKSNPKYLIPFLDSPSCGGNEEIKVLRQRLEKNGRHTLKQLAPQNRSCLRCF